MISVMPGVAGLEPNGAGTPALQSLFDEAEELSSGHPIDDPVVEGEAHVHHVPDRDPIANHDRSTHDRLGREDGRLRLVDDRLAGHRPGGAGVVKRKVPPATSSGLSCLLRARSARSLMARARSAK